MKTLSLLLVFVSMTIQSSSAQEIKHLIGDWKGFINIQGNHLIIKAHFTQADSGLDGTIDIPQQGGKGLKLHEITHTDDDSVSWSQNTGGNGIARHKGQLKTVSDITGTFSQNGAQFPFRLERFEPDTVAEKEPLPYHHKDMIIKNDSIDIGGTLTWPNDQQAKQLVIIISGSGIQNRDGALPVTNFKPYAELADSLTMNGIATFRYDDRGIGESGGDPNAGLNELTKDVQVIYDSLRNRQQFSRASIGLLGHSQGGYIADKLAAKNANIGFIVLMSAPSFPLSDIILQQSEAIEKAKGTPDSTIQKGLQNQGDLYRAMQEGKLDSLKKTKISELESELANLPEQKKKQIDNIHAYATQKVNQQLAPVTLPIFQSMLWYDPIEDIEKIHVPILALFGEKDLQVLPGINAQRLRTVLKKSDADYTIKILDGANHLYQKAETGLPSEYGTLPSQFVEGFTSTIIEWIKNY